MRKTKREMLAKIEADHGAKPVDAKLVENNTVYYKIGDREFWRLHETDVVAHDLKSGKWTLNSGGWRTLTTRDRINKFAPVSLFQVGGIWRVAPRDGGNSVPYADGIVVDDSGHPPAASLGRLRAAEAEQKRLLDLIAKFCRKARKVIIEKGKPMPGAGDCWDCAMQTTDGRSMGDVSKSDHLLQHVKEGYVHGSLLFRAVQDRSYGDPALVFQIADADQLIRDLRRYLKRRLGLAAPSTIR